MIDAPLIISLLVFSATVLFVAAYLVHLGYVRGHQTLVQKINQDGRTVTFGEAGAPVPPSPGSALEGGMAGDHGPLGGPREAQGR